jgi:hypothetical protein
VETILFENGKKIANKVTERVLVSELKMVDLQMPVTRIM